MWFICKLLNLLKNTNLHISIGMMYKEIFLNHQISIIGNSKAFETYSTYLKAVFIKISKELDRLCVKLWLTLYSSIAMQSKLTKLTGNLPSAHNFRTLQEQVVLVTSISLLLNIFTTHTSTGRDFIPFFSWNPAIPPLPLPIPGQGYPGSTHVSTVLQHSDFLPNSNDRIQPEFCLLGDSGFSLIEWLITHFRNHGNLTRQPKFVNKSHSKMPWGYSKGLWMLKNRFWRLKKQIEMLDLTLLKNSVLAGCVLNNICISEDDGCDLPVEPQ